jgi:adenosylcobinamide-phosphate synthase
MDAVTAWIVIPFALVLDMLLGDPRWLPHPVRLMGLAVSRLEEPFRRLPVGPVTAGALFTGFLAALAYVSSAFLLWLCARVSPAFGTLAQIMLLYTCLAARALAREAQGVEAALKAEDLPLARKRVGMIVSRNAAVLDARGVTRAAVETVAENFVDGVLSPLVFAAVLGVPGAVAFKMASTLDSMVGYRNARYEKFGKASARLDDVLNFLPARLSVPLIALSAFFLFRSGKRAFATALMEGGNHKSPNAGLPEAAFAGALGVRLNGPAEYHGMLEDKPYLGVRHAPPVIEDISRACRLMEISTAAGAVFLLLAVHVFA